jgi:hypothetical protein
MYFDDLSHYGYYMPKALDSVLNVGWLEHDKPYSVGAAPPVLVNRLAQVMSLEGTTCVHVNRIRSTHPCNLCGADSFNDVDPSGKLLVGASEIWIPRSGGGFFAAPSMLLHYIVRHGYMPPVEFSAALMEFDIKKPYLAQAAYEELAATVMS